MSEQDLQRLSDAQTAQPGLAEMIPAIVIGVVAALLIYVSLWKVFSKAGEPGWAAIVPIYNLVVGVKISGKPLWWIVLFFVPCVSFVAAILIGIALAERFGKGVAFGLGLVFFPYFFLPVLAFGSAQYTPARG